MNSIVVTTEQVAAIRQAARVVFIENRGLVLLCPAHAHQDQPEPVTAAVASVLDREELGEQLAAAHSNGHAAGSELLEFEIDPAHRHPHWRQLAEAVRPGDELRMIWARERDELTVIVTLYRNDVRCFATLLSSADSVDSIGPPVQASDVRSPTNSALPLLVFGAAAPATTLVVAGIVAAIWHFTRPLRRARLPRRCPG